MEKRGAVAGRERVIGAAGEVGAAFVLAENGGELGKERDFADRGARLREDAVGRDATPPGRELITDVNHTCGEVDVVPGEAEHFGEPQAGVCACEEQWPAAARAGGKETNELCAGEDTVVRAQRVRPLVALEPVEGMCVDVAAPKREREDPAERAEDPLDRPGQKTVRLQLAPNGDDVVGCDQHQAASAQPG